jgi:hypothetical protein
MYLDGTFRPWIYLLHGPCKGHWVWVHPGGFVMFRPKSKSYWILNKFFIEKSVKLKIFRKIGQDLHIVGKPLMSRISWRWFHYFQTSDGGDIEFCVFFVIENSTNYKNWFWKENKFTLGPNCTSHTTD